MTKPAVLIWPVKIPPPLMESVVERLSGGADHMAGIAS